MWLLKISNDEILPLLQCRFMIFSNVLPRSINIEFEFDFNVSLIRMNPCLCRTELNEIGSKSIFVRHTIHLPSFEYCMWWKNLSVHYKTMHHSWRIYIALLIKSTGKINHTCIKNINLCIQYPTSKVVTKCVQISYI